jgi:hypothetical protein
MLTLMATVCIDMPWGEIGGVLVVQTKFEVRDIFKDIQSSNVTEAKVLYSRCQK